MSRSLTGKKYPHRQKEPPRYSICKNPNCGVEFLWRYWRPAHNPILYCSIKCSIKTIGSLPTSPRAARAKSGIRTDINPNTYFFSRWEANFARILNLMGIRWVHQPMRFQLRSQKYTPDFYLPDFDIYVEIKNYLSDYSLRRDSQFRELYPELRLSLILKPQYLKLQEKFAPLIGNWEHS
jgi:hypothetical protein